MIEEMYPVRSQKEMENFHVHSVIQRVFPLILAKIAVCDRPAARLRTDKPTGPIQCWFAMTASVSSAF